MLNVSVAQSAERWFETPEVVGSVPTRHTMDLLSSGLDAGLQTLIRGFDSHQILQ